MHILQIKVEDCIFQNYDEHKSGTRINKPQYVKQLQDSFSCQREKIFKHDSAHHVLHNIKEIARIKASIYRVHQA